MRGRQRAFELGERRSIQRLGAGISLRHQHTGQAALHGPDSPVVVAVDAANHRERVSEVTAQLVVLAFDREDGREVVRCTVAT